MRVLVAGIPYGIESSLAGTRKFNIGHNTGKKIVGACIAGDSDHERQHNLPYAVPNNAPVAQLGE